MTLPVSSRNRQELQNSKATAIKRGINISLCKALRKEIRPRWQWSWSLRTYVSDTVNGRAFDALAEAAKGLAFELAGRSVKEVHREFLCVEPLKEGASKRCFGCPAQYIKHRNLELVISLTPRSNLSKFPWLGRSAELAVWNYGNWVASYFDEEESYRTYGVGDVLAVGPSALIGAVENHTNDFVDYARILYSTDL